MASLKEILIIGDPRLYETSDLVLKEELPLVDYWVKDLADVLKKAQKKLGIGRGIAGPQLGIMRRLIYLHIDKPQVIINPEITYRSPETMVLWDDCLSIPNLLVRVKRNMSIKVRYLDENWTMQEIKASGKLSELLQHEIDHLDGILCTMRAMDKKSFKIAR